MIHGVVQETAAGKDSVGKIKALFFLRFLRHPYIPGNINREIAADNKLLKEIKARITRLYNWSKEQAGQSDGKESILDFLFQARQETTSTSCYAKVDVLKANANLYNFSSFAAYWD